MFCRTKIKMLLFTFLLFIKTTNCHLKDLGEETLDISGIAQDIEKRIVGGTPTTLDQYPFNVLFLNYGGICSGIILAKKTVLTAAHCFDLNSNIAEMKVLSCSRYVLDHRSRTHSVWDFLIHEQYNKPRRYANDVAVIIIHDKFVFGIYAKKAKLTTNIGWMKENETSFVATGWGETEYGGKLSQRGLLKTHLRYLPNKKCSTLTKTILSPGMFCLYGDGDRDTCRGDSGGGILWNDEVVGIISHGSGCGKKPGVYANIHYFRQWIDESIVELNRRFCRFHTFK